MANRWPLYGVLFWTMRLSKTRLWMMMMRLLLMVSWWRRTSFACYSSVSEFRMNHSSSTTLQYRGTKTDEVSTTHLVALASVILTALWVVAIPGSRECVVKKRIHAPTRVRGKPCRNLRDQFRAPSLLNQKVRDLIRDQRNRVGFLVCLHVAVG